MLVAVSGVDCCGKSTQIDLLRGWLAEQGLTCQILWHRPGYSKRLDAFRAGVRRAFPRVLPPPGPNASRERVMKRRGVRLLWPRVALADTLVQYALSVRLAMRTNDVVICDRYVWDAIIDLTMNFPEASEAKALLSNRLVTMPDLELFISVPWELVLERAARKNEPFPDSPETRRRRYEIYERLLQQREFTVIDGSKDIDTVHRQIVHAVSTCMAARSRAHAHS